MKLWPYQKEDDLGAYSFTTRLQPIVWTLALNMYLAKKLDTLLFYKKLFIFGKNYSTNDKEFYAIICALIH